METALHEPYAKLRERLGQVADLVGAAAVLSWDQETLMPPGGAQARAEQLATLQTLAHRIFTSDEVGAHLEALAPWAASLPYDAPEASLVRVATRDFRERIRVPAALVEETVRTTSLAMQSWAAARGGKGFAYFEPHLERIVELRLRWVECFAPYENPYDPLLDHFEPGMTYAAIRTVFDGLKPPLIELVQAIASNRDAVDDSVLSAPLPEAAQLALSHEVTERLGYDYSCGRLDLSAHPFSTRLGAGDVRITTRFSPERPLKMLMSSIHEAGHGMHAQAVTAELARTGLDGGPMQAICESQSRFYENVIGRSLPFWRWLHPTLERTFAPAFDGTTPEQIYGALNRVEPGLVRVEADEVTYGLHVMLRFELENDLMNGRVGVADLPREWNDRTEAYLGVRPANDADGVLQDVHWAMGYIGYFPDYLLGSVFAVQLRDRMLGAMPDLDERVERGEFGGVLTWLKEHVMRHGRSFTLPEMAERAVGGPLRWEPYMAYLRERYGALYGV